MSCRFAKSDEPNSNFCHLSTVKFRTISLVKPSPTSKGSLSDFGEDITEHICSVILMFV